MAGHEEEKAILDLQERIMTGHQAMQRLSAQERVATNRKARTQLTLEELNNVPDQTRMYKSVGKAYFLSPKSELVETAKEIVASSEKDITDIRTQRGVVEKKISEAQAEFKELVQAKQLAGMRVS